MEHHAYYIEGSASEFEAHKAALKPFWAQKYERFGVDDSRELIALAALKNFSSKEESASGGKTAVFFIGAVSITSEAQQALLKLFEEPQQGTTFVLLAPHGALLATLKSRMLPYPKLTKDGPLFTKGPSFVTEAKKFLKMGGKERSDFIVKMLKDEDELKERVRDFINALETECIRLNFAQTLEGRGALEDIAVVRDYVGDRAPALKMLLEHLALSVPVI